MLAGLPITARGRKSLNFENLKMKRFYQIFKCVGGGKPSIMRVKAHLKSRGTLVFSFFFFVHAPRTDASPLSSLERHYEKRGRKSGVVNSKRNVRRKELANIKRAFALQRDADAAFSWRGERGILLGLLGGGGGGRVLLLERPPQRDKVGIVHKSPIHKLLHLRANLLLALRNELSEALKLYRRELSPHEGVKLLLNVSNETLMLRVLVVLVRHSRQGGQQRAHEGRRVQFVHELLDGADDGVEELVVGRAAGALDVDLLLLAAGVAAEVEGLNVVDLLLISRVGHGSLFKNDFDGSDEYDYLILMVSGDCFAERQGEEEVYLD